MVRQLNAKIKRCCANCKWCDEKMFEWWNADAAEYCTETYLRCIGQKNAPKIYDARREVCEGFRERGKE